MATEELRCFLCGVDGGWGAGAVRMPDGRRAHYGCIMRWNRLQRAREARTVLATNGRRAKA